MVHCCEIDVNASLVWRKHKQHDFTVLKSFFNFLAYVRMDHITYNFQFKHHSVLLLGENHGTQNFAADLM